MLKYSPLVIIGNTSSSLPLYVAAFCLVHFSVLRAFSACLLEVDGDAVIVNENQEVFFSPPGRIYINKITTVAGRYLFSLWEPKINPNSVFGTQTESVKGKKDEYAIRLSDESELPLESMSIGNF